MICLGIESTAHTFGVGLADGKKCIANEKVMYRTEGGIHPREAAQFMAAHAHEVLGNALKGKFDTLAFAQGPGLGPCLNIGASIAKSLSDYYNKPVVGVNHCISHIDVGKWECGCRDPLVVYVSGANTQILGLKAGRYRIYGETLDIGLGNALDAFGRHIGLPFPAGPEIEKIARGGTLIELPYTVKGMDLAFSGLLTAAKRRPGSKRDMCYSMQEYAFGMLCEVAERALAHTKKSELMLVGGVAQNKRLTSMLGQMAKEHGASFHVPKNEFNADNGFMIALTGWQMHKAGVRQKSLETDQKWRTDDVAVSW